MVLPLDGIKIVEINAFGPVALFGWIMADLGATIIRVDRPSSIRDHIAAPHVSNRPVIELNFKRPEAVDTILTMVRNADVLVEGYRPGVMERLGMGPDVCLGVNPALVYTRCTGWGQTGALSMEPGHDINYLALTGALAAIGTAERPIVPLNLGADYGGGSMLACLGVLAALLHAKKTGQGQVIDVAMVDGVGTLFSLFYELYNGGQWINAREANFLDGAAPFYRCYECKDGKFMAVGAMEMKFRSQVGKILGIPEFGDPSSDDPSNWPALAERAAAVFRTATRDEWTARMHGQETCCTPVLDLTEAPLHQHNIDRAAFLRSGGGWTPAPAPIFSHTPARRVAPRPVDEVLSEFGVSKVPA